MLSDTPTESSLITAVHCHRTAETSVMACREDLVVARVSKAQWRKSWEET